MSSSVYLPPGRTLPPHDHLRVFLAGAIDMGKAEPWQEDVAAYFDTLDPISFFNPRRKDWDSTWEQKLGDNPFTEQVNWELDMIEQSDIVLIYFPATSQAPISLLEFGWVMGRDPGKAIVVAEPGYWRRGNLEVVCNRERVFLHDNLRAGIFALEEVLNAHAKHF